MHVLENENINLFSLCNVLACVCELVLSVIMSKLVVAEYDYNGEDTTQLTFKEGDRIVVIEEDDSGWWTGRLEKDGSFITLHSEYTKELSMTVHSIYSI